MRDLAAGRQVLQLGERKRAGTSDHAVNGEPPVSKPSGEQALIRLLRRCLSVHRNHFRNLAALELARHRRKLSEKSLPRIGERLAEAINAAAIRGNQTVAIRNAHCGTQCPSASDSADG